MTDHAAVWTQSMAPVLPQQHSVLLQRRVSHQQLLQEAQDGQIEELKNVHKHLIHGLPQYQVMWQWQDKYGKQSFILKISAIHPLPPATIFTVTEVWVRPLLLANLHITLYSQELDIHTY